MTARWFVADVSILTELDADALALELDALLSRHFARAVVRDIDPEDD